MKVLKFGGTSVGTVESLNNVKKIIESISDKAIIVVSALGGLTDKLISTANMALKGDGSWENEMFSIKERHFQIMEKVLPEDLKATTRHKVNLLLEDLESKFENIFKEKQLTEDQLNDIVSFGERISSFIVAAMVKNGKRYYSPDFIKTEKWYGKNIADRKLTDRLIRETFNEIKDNEKAIVPGFISTDSTTGQITNLGRGGSDYTGALIAASMDAEILEIWTDVDGFMTADPRIVKEALIIDHLTFNESMELCTFGAKVIYPPTIYPVFHKNIPIKILNTFNPEAPGTLITDQVLNDDREIKGVTTLKDVSLILLEVKDSNKLSDLSKKVFNTLSKQAVRIIPVSHSDSSLVMKFALLSSNTDISLKMLEEEFETDIKKEIIKRPELIDNLSAVALVGKHMRSKKRLAARIGHSLMREGIIVEAYSIGNSDTTIVYIIKQEKSSKALHLIHSIVFNC